MQFNPNRPGRGGVLDIYISRLAVLDVRYLDMLW